MAERIIINSETGEITKVPLTTDEESYRESKYKEWESKEVEREKKDEIKAIKFDLSNAVAWQFKMILELFEVGISKGVWSNTDFLEDTQKKVDDWKVKIDRLVELGG